MITYRFHKGAPLTTEEMDGNFRDLDERVKSLERHLEGGEGIGKIVCQGDTLTVVGSQGAELGTFPLPKVSFSPRGEWSSQISYLARDIVAHEHSLYYCLHDHISTRWGQDISFWHLIMTVSPPSRSLPLYEKETLPPQADLGAFALFVEEKGPSLIFFDGSEWQRLGQGDPL